MRCKQPACIYKAVEDGYCKMHLYSIRAAKRNCKVSGKNNRWREDPTEQQWIEMCQNGTARDIQDKHGFGWQRQQRFNERYGIFPYQRCMACGLLPREKFSSLAIRKCIDCVENPKKPPPTYKVYQRNHDQVVEGTGPWMEYAKAKAREPWSPATGMRGCFRVQGQWSEERDGFCYGGYWWWWGEYE